MVDFTNELFQIVKDTKFESNSQLNRHYGDKEHEKKNIPLTMDDIKNIPYLLNFGQLRRQTNNLRLDAYGVEFYVYVPNGEKISLMISPRTDDNGDTLFLWNMRIERR